MKNVLFVDDEPNLLAGLRRTLHPPRGEWQMSFAVGSAQAIEFLEQSSFDVVVTDMHMPGLDGADLLSQVKQRFPNAVRIILSGTAEREQILRSVGHAHQFVVKPCTANELKSTVQRALALRELLANERLVRVT